MPDIETSIQPALTPEEWANLPPSGLPLYCRSRHALAALALYGQPFGFTHEDVAPLKVFVDRMRDVDDAGPLGEGWQSDERIAGIAAADRILARLTSLLPPK